jgi:hypothetical protein
MSVYRITPLEKKSIYYKAEMYRNNSDGTISWFNVEDHYRWGQGFIEEEMDCNLPYSDDDQAYCDPNAGWGAELDDQVACFFEFSDDITEEEQEKIKEDFYNGGAGWLHEGDHEWQFEDDYIIVLGPFQVDLCDDSGTILEENIKLKDRPTLSNNWPNLNE